MRMASAQSISDDRQKPLTSVVYVVLFLVFTTAMYVSLSFGYDRHLINTRQFGWLRTVHGYSVVSDSLFYALQLVIALSFFRPLSGVFAGERKEHWAAGLHILKHILWGISGGILALAIGALVLLRSDSYQGLGAFLANHAYNLSGVLLVVLLIFFLPIASEGFFRGVLLRRMLQSVSGPAAVVLAALLFAFLWPTFTLVPGLAIGLVSGILFCRTKSLLPCIVANSVFTIGGIILLMWRAM
jgi:membrane protease YdiL (CAAX protease family)